MARGHHGKRIDTGGHPDRMLLEESLGYRFSDPDLLSAALTHSSATAANGAPVMSERLEFLGDRVLGLIVAEELFRRFPDAAEGELAVRLNGLVRKERCAEVAGRIGLGDHLVLGPSERRVEGRVKPTVLADACEAVIAALYLDAGFEAARRFVLGAWGSFDMGPVRAQQDAKTALQERAQGRGLTLPRYEVRDRHGPDHAPEFVVEVSIDGLGAAMGQGASKRLAEQAAAEALLGAHELW
ncbi:MAG: ribonuclease III [Parvibaculaceae bacterium]|nr:ribonuclease III [Parvibaculaceae bacterium]